MKAPGPGSRPEGARRVCRDSACGPGERAGAVPSGPVGRADQVRPAQRGQSASGSGAAVSGPPHRIIRANIYRVLTMVIYQLISSLL